jgi:hypothetical protein
LGVGGWLVQSNETCVLVDPLLRERFGRTTGGFKYPPIWPPRRFTFERFPTVSAVIISHEHEDHFDIESLHWLDRRIRIYLSGRSSVAPSIVLKEMGFEVFLLEAGRRYRFGSLELFPLTPDHAKMSNSDEWDCLSLLFRDIEQGGAFFTSVDVVPTGQMLQIIRREITTGWLLSFRDGKLSWTSQSYLEQMLFGNAHAPINGLATDDLENCLENESGAWLMSGQSVTVTGNQILRTESCKTFLSTLERDHWPPPPITQTVSDGYGPITGRREITKREMAELVDYLVELARHLYGGGLFRKLLSFSSETLGVKKPSLLLLLIADEASTYIAFEYDYCACKFRSVRSENPPEEYVCGIECWATDLLEVMRGHLEPRALMIGHSRHWTSGRIAPDPFLAALIPFAHPLRQPEKRLAVYRELAKDLKPDVKVLFRVNGNKSAL